MKENDKFTFKKVGYSNNGRPLLSVPCNTDIVFFDFESGGYRKVTNNYEIMMKTNLNVKALKLLTSFDELLTEFFCSTEEKTGYYLINHSIQKCIYLGNAREWDVIVSTLDGKRAETYFPV